MGQSAKERIARMSADEKADLLRRFNTYVDNGNDNREAQLTFQEVELLVAIVDTMGNVD